MVSHYTPFTPFDQVWEVEGGGGGLKLQGLEAFGKCRMTQTPPPAGCIWWTKLDLTFPAGGIWWIKLELTHPLPPAGG